MKRHVFLKMDNGVALEVEADVFGEWAVHVSPDRWVHGLGKTRRAITITHVPSGLRAGCAETVGIPKREAFKIARHLKRTIPTGMSADEAFGREVYRQILIAVWGFDPRERAA